MSAKPIGAKKTNNAKKSYLDFIGTSLSHADPDFLRDQLSKYKYVAPNKSLFEILFLNAFWEKVVTIYPMWLAPNLITFMGFLATLSASVFLFILSPNLKGECPRWWFAYAAIAQFTYQTMDGSDGKQARRTKSGSPLGELFDHGVDVLVTTIISAFSVEIYAYGCDAFPVCLSFLGVHLAFFFSIFTALHTGKQRFGLFDCQEIQIWLQFSLIFSSIFGIQIWRTLVPVPSSFVQQLPLWFYNWKEIGHDGIELRFILSMVVVFGTSYSVLAANISVFYFYVTEGNKFAGLEGRGVFAVVSQIFVIVVQSVMLVISWITAKNLSNIDPSASIAWYLVYGLTFSDITNHALLTRTAYLPFPSLWRSRAFIGNVVFHITLLIDLGSWTISVRWIVVFLIAVSNLQYCVTMGNAICDALNIRFFKIPYKQE